MARQFLEFLREYDVPGELVRIVDHHVPPGMETDLGDGDQWPEIWSRILAADILVFVTPIWMGHPASVAQLVLERLNAGSGETDADGNPVHFNRVAVAGVVGNEDGAHKVTADVYQALNDVGFTIPAQGGTYWVGEAMHTTDYNDLAETPEATEAAMRVAVANAVHLSGLLLGDPYVKV